MWPTPTADDASNVNPKPNRFRGLVAAVNETTPTGGKLNPAFVEWLMGFPIGWTELKD
jgi:DNA (cytosine-5)-methyltransferase 1